MNNQSYNIGDVVYDKNSGKGIVRFSAMGVLRVAFGEKVRTYTPQSALGLIPVYGDFAITDGTIIRYVGIAQNVRLPQSVFRIGPAAFAGCSVTTVNFGGFITEIGARAFENCGALTGITGLQGLKIIESEAFSDCVKLTRLELPECLEQVGARAFRGCASLQKINLPDTVESVPEYCFENCKNLTTVEGTEHVVEIGKGAFNLCRSLHFDLPETLTSIGEDAFFGCPLMRPFNVPDSVSFIGARAFQTGFKRDTIYGVPGSYAEKYAHLNRLRFADRKTVGDFANLAVQEKSALERRDLHLKISYIVLGLTLIVILAIAIGKMLAV